MIYSSKIDCESQYLPMYANHGEESTPRNNYLFTKLTFWAVSSLITSDLMERNLCMPETHNVIWLLIWNDICQFKKKQTGYGCSCSKIK